ncbi:hypothetical protein E2C01_064079 [Portunus trituberculatus]|uniref:Uncharacterized protein n=1 Tax=Portunus trituberculatus TaxID=210409 RepID=A0A5B7HMB1_PORTR|nr:hypothetical protein [Portunus trituberculatus]
MRALGSEESPSARVRNLSTVRVTATSRPAQSRVTSGGWQWKETAAWGGSVIVHRSEPNESVMHRLPPAN